MNTILALAVYACSVSLFALAAHDRALVYGKSMNLLNRRTAPLLGTAACAAAIASHERAFAWMSVVIMLAAVAVSAASDLETGYIFDVVTLSAFAGIAACAGISGTIVDSVTGAVLCAGVLAALHLCTRGRGMGLGDVKLAGVIGCGLGGSAALIAIGVAFIIGAATVSILLVVRRARRNDAVPFGPYLALGAVALVLLRGIHG